MSHQEQQYIYNSNYNDEENYEVNLKQRKLAKLCIFFCFIGILAGVSASISFFFVYKIIQAPLFAVLSGIYHFILSFNFLILLIYCLAIIAAFACFIHIQFLRNLWQIWTYRLKYWNKLGFVLQILSIILFFVYLILGIYYKDGKFIFAVKTLIFIIFFFYYF